ncbi:tripartite tricarboxylate transporter substrate binding protein [Paenibacillus cisolokensis]|uniref:tripartite tricarboxylate transporter substrate binding protein n=1 Tax=Paenibacillus cisolokensis TaxID=1658519 RepID=UPI003D2C9AB0
MKRQTFVFKIAVLISILAILAACASKGNGGQQANNAPETNNAQEANNGAEAKETDYPAKNIELIVPFNAGGVSDILARSFVEASTGIINQPITVKNVDGASGTVGNYQLVQAKPDGYTWLWASTGHISSSLHITPAQYTRDDFTVVNKVGEMVVAIVVPKDSPFQTLDDYIKYAKENPGKLTVGNPGEGTVVALLARLLEDKAGIQLQHVPYQGSGPLLPSVLGNHVMSAFMNVPEVRGQVESGELRALAVLSEKRVDQLPDVPTAEEQGIEGLAGGAGHYIVIPNNVPEEVVRKIDELTKAVYESDKFKELMEQAGYQLGYKNSADALKELDEWYETTGELYKKLGMIK